jgi:hypothetical protein
MALSPSRKNLINLRGFCGLTHSLIRSRIYQGFVEGQESCRQ